MYEETGATKINVIPVSVYKISSYGLLCYCEIEELGELPQEYEMQEIMFSSELPPIDQLTFKESTK